MSVTEVIALITVIPFCVYFSWRSGSVQGAVGMAFHLYEKKMLTPAAIKTLGLDSRK